MRYLFAAFMIPFYVSPVLMFAVGLLLFREGRRLAKQSAVLRVDAAGLSLDFMMPHSQTHDAWRRDEVERIQTASWTRINQREILHAEVVTADRAVRFGAGCPAEELEAICVRARAVLFGQET